MRVLHAFVQLALWEEYADEVEEQMRVLLADNALLQAAMADVRSSLAHERPSSTSGAGLASTPAASHPIPMRSAHAACCQCSIADGSWRVAAILALPR